MALDPKSPWAVLAAEHGARIINEMPMEEYQADVVTAEPSLSSGLANILLTQSPRHAMLAHPRLNPHYQREEDSRFDLGSAAHCLLIERNAAPIVWCEFDDWRTKAAREARDEARARRKLPVLAHFKEPLMAMVRTAYEFIQASELAGILDTGTAEQSIFWREAGVWCRCRPDMISKDRSVILDYKSTTDAEPETFIRQIGRMGYAVQAELYSRGVLQGDAASAGVGARQSGVARLGNQFVFLAQEITAPYACSLIGLSEAYKEVARVKVDRALRLWSECMKNQLWPAYDSRIRYAEPAALELAAIETDDAP